MKEIAQRQGYMASFMTKPYADQSGNGCHYHQSLLDAKRGATPLRNGPAR